jgi:hypothetical protein
MITETRNELIDKIIKTYELQTPDVADAVELYYDAQKLRIMHGNKERTEAPSQLTEWLLKWLQFGEHVITGKLKEWVTSQRSPAEAKWSYDQIGIGPIIAAGLAAHIDPVKAESPSAVWKFAGLAPGFDRRTRGEKSPYNSRLKVLCWKLGESFVKVSGKDDVVYGKLYARFKADEVSRNENGLYQKAAAEQLAAKKFKENATKKRLQEGKLSDAHLHARAKRRAVKIFLVHYWQRAREARGLEVRGPYVEQILRHDGIV